MNIAFSALSGLALRSDVWIGTIPKWDCAPEEPASTIYPSRAQLVAANLVAAKLSQPEYRAILSAVIPQGTPGIRGIPDGYFPGIPHGYRWVFQGINGYFAKT